MPRGKVLIEDSTALEVLSSKRCEEVIKKAKELSTLCDAQVGVIVFSAASKLTYFGDPGINEIIERWNTHPDIIQAPEKPPLDLNVQEEIEKCDEEELIVRQMEGEGLGEDFENLSTMEQLNLLEEMLQNLLNRVKEQRELKEKTSVDVQHKIHLVEEKDQTKQKEGVPT